MAGPIPESFITPVDAAAFLGTTINTLNWRRATQVACPPYWKSNDSAKAAVKYLLSELDMWRRGEWAGPICRIVGQPKKKAAS